MTLRLQTGDRVDQVEIGRDAISPLDVTTVAVARAAVFVDPVAYHRLARARAVVENVLASSRPAYGVNRGLGPARDQQIPLELMSEFQEFIIESHAAAVGQPLSRHSSRAVVFTRAAIMAQGGSGASRALFDGLLALLERDVTPVIPVHGSVGSADLAQLAAVGAVLLGKGRAYGPGTKEVVTGAEALRRAGLAPIRLEAKDGLALVGSNAASIGLSALLHGRLETAGYIADLTAAFTLEALSANLSPFSETVISARPLPGQIRSAARIRSFLSGGSMAAGELLTRSLQDPLSVRTIPQVHGVFQEQVRGLENVLLIELNSPSENPLIDAATDSILSNGNFSVLGLALALESIRLAIAHMAIMVERRIAMLVQTVRSSADIVDHIRSSRGVTVYPAPVLIANTASALTARIKHHSNPVTIMGTTVGDGVEDHNSQAYYANRFTSDALESLEQLQAIEALMALEVLHHQQRRGETPTDRRFGDEVGRVLPAIESAIASLGPDPTTDDVVNAVSTALHGVAGELQQIVPAPMPSPVAGFEHDPQQ